MRTIKWMLNVLHGNINVNEELLFLIVYVNYSFKTQCTDSKDFRTCKHEVNCLESVAQLIAQ